MSQELQDHPAVARVRRITSVLDRALEKAAALRPHWVIFLVAGPGGAAGAVKVYLRTPKIRLLDETNTTYLRAQLRAIRRVKKDHGMECWPLRSFACHAYDWSDTVDRHNDTPRPVRQV